MPDRSPTPDRVIHLASTSPRRAKLLREAGWRFEQIAPPFDDGPVALGDCPPARAAEALAYLKAATAADTLDAGLVVGSDTVLDIAGHLVGKPTDEADARRILTRLFAGPHDVVTGVALVDAATGASDLFHDRTTVRIADPGDAALRQHLASGAWRGKAGGYNLAELEGDWLFAVDGDPTTVIGLPMAQLAAQLATFIDRLESANGS